VAGLRRLAGPWLLVIVVSAAFGGITAFVPLRFAGSAAAPACLFGMSAAVIAGRWTAGARSDRASSGGLLTASVAACALGMAGLAASAALGAASIALPAAVAYGLGFGALQNDTLIVMFRRGGPAGHGLASTAWNLAIDAGTGVGATAIGWGSGALGLGGAFAVSAAAIAALTPVTLGIRRRASPTAGR
jgi:predicted MFS family arabinose efflux permease